MFKGGNDSDIEFDDELVGKEVVLEDEIDDYFRCVFCNMRLGCVVICLSLIWDIRFFLYGII